MKKYDLMIAGVYILLTLTALLVSFNFLNSQIKTKERAGSYMKSLYQEPIRVVAIRQTDLHLTVVKGVALNGKEQHFKLQGIMDTHDIYQCRVVGDTLLIDGAWNTPTNLILHVAPGIQVDTLGAPRVKITAVNTQTE